MRISTAFEDAFWYSVLFEIWSFLAISSIVNLTILRMILITSTHNLNDADFLREQNMTGTDVMNVLEDIILHGIEK